MSDSEGARAVGAAIIGGYLDTTTNGVVALALQDRGQVEVFCSGSLLAPNLVLTARHCIAQIGDGSSEQVMCKSTQFTSEYDSSTIYVSTDAQPQTSKGQLYSVAQILEAPGSQTVCGFDVALLILSGAGVPSTAATPIVPELTAITAANTPFSAVGYGLQRADDTQNTTAGNRMRFDGASVSCVGTSCPANAANAADEWLGNSPVCSGDSGGPALSANGRVFGVTSRGPSDCSYALYSNVADWADFIRSTAKLAATAGGYPPPDWADPLGEQCSGSCPGSYQCFSANGAPPGICVPPCAQSGAACPVDYTCADSLNVCVPAKDITHSGSGSASCAVSRVPAPERTPGWAAWFVVFGSAWAFRRRRGVR